MSSELVADTSYDLYPEILNSVAIQDALAKDTKFFNHALTACTNCITASATGVASSTLTGTDLSQLITSVENQNIMYVDDDSVFWMSPSVKAIYREMKTSMGTFMFPQLSQGIDVIFNHRIISTNIMPNASATASGTIMVYFGNPKYVF